MIRSAVGVFLFMYFLGSNAMAPIRPGLFNDPLVIFHHEINRGMSRIVGPPVRFAQSLFIDSDEQKVELRPTIAPSEEVSGEGKS